LILITSVVGWSQIQQQANVNESLETAFLWVDTVAGSDSNPGTQLLPLKTIAAATSIAVTDNSQGIGTQININPGTYRESITLTGPNQSNLPITFQAATPATVFISGAVSYTNWTAYSANPSMYTTPWPNQWGFCQADSGGAPFEPPVVLRREMVFVNGTQMTEVLSLAQVLFPGTFFVDEVNQVMYVWPPAGTTMSAADVEVATLPRLLSIYNFNNLVFRNLTFEYAASCHQDRAVSVEDSSSNLEFISDTFTWNGGEGFSILHPASLATVQNSTANHNGAAGFNAVKTRNIYWQNVEASYNNWRGAQGAYYTWNTAGAHIFGDHEETVSAFKSIYNQTFGIHWDTDVQKLMVNSLTSVWNLSGVLIESSEGPISIGGGIFCDTQHSSTADGGLVVRDTEYLTLTNSTFYNNGNSQITTSGLPGGSPAFTDWETGMVYSGLNTQYLTMSGNTIQGVGAAQEDFKYGYIGASEWTNFKSFLNSSENTWWADNSNAFTVATPKPGTVVNFAGWQSATGQDSQSSFSLPTNSLAAVCAVTTDAPDWQLVVDNGIVTAGTAGTAVFNLTAVAIGGFSGMATFAVDGLSAMPGSTVTFSPSSIGIPGTSALTFVAGPQTAGGTYTFTVLANIENTTRTIALTVTIANAPLTLSPSALTFLPQTVGTTSSTQTVTVTNSGSSPVTLSSIIVPSGFSQTNTCGTSVAAASTCSATVAFSPQALTPYSGLLTLAFPGMRPEGIPLTGTAAGTSTTVLSSSGAISYGQSVSFTATVTGVPAGTTPTGTITFLDSGISLGTAPLNSSGVGSFTATSLSTGAHTITAAYSGDTNFAASTSSPLIQTVNPATSTVNVTPSSSASIYGMPLTFTAALTPSTATGSVQFLVDGVLQSTAPVAAATAVFTTSALLPGSHQIVANYQGDTNDAAGSSPAITVTISQITPVITLSASSNPAQAGTSLTLTATVNPLTATGTVTFLDGTTTIAQSVQISAGSATTSVTLTSGVHNLTAMYGGDALDLPGAGTLTETVYNTPVGSNVAVTDTSGDTITFNTVSQFGTTTVTQTAITDPSFPAPLPSNYIPAPSANFFNIATTAVVTGSVNVCLSYAGVTYIQPSTLTLLHYDTTLTPPAWTPTTGQINTQNTTTICGNALTLGAFIIVQNTTATITLTSSANPSAFGQAVTFTATITPSTATGSVAFGALGTASVANGAATLTTAQLTAGAQTITATYTDPANFFTSVTTQLNQTVNQSSTTVAVMSSSGAATYGTQLTFTAKITPATANGSVQFLVDGVAQSTATVTAGTAVYSTTSLLPGSHQVTANYLGDTNDSGSTSPAVIVTVSQITPVVTLASSANPVLGGTSVTVTATVNPPSATGSVTFLDGTTTLAQGIPLSGGSAGATVTLSVGVHSLTAMYGGDALDLPATGTLSETVYNTPVGSNVAVTDTSGDVVTFTAVSQLGITSVTPTLITDPSFPAPLPGNYVPAPIGSFFNLTTTAVASGSINICLSYAGVSYLQPSTLTLLHYDTTLTPPAWTPTTSQTNTQSTTTICGNALALGNFIIVQNSTATVALTSSANPSAFGQSVTFTATVTPSTATGSVTFTSLGSVAVVNGVASLSTAHVNSGANVISATYNDPTNFFSTATTQLTQTVSQSSSSITVTPTALSSVYGTPLTFTAVVTPATATGSVQFLVDGALQSTGTLASAMAAYSTAGLLPGIHQITASYLGDTNDAGSSSPPIMVSVSQIAPVVTLSASANPVQAGPSVTLTASVYPPTATGSVTFLDGTNSFAQGVQLSGGSATATVTLVAGVHSLTAMYGGDALDMPGTGSLTETVYNTPVGSNVVVSPAVGDTITFTTVSQLGITSITATAITDPSFPAPLPSNYLPAPAPNFFNIATTAVTTGSINVCLSYAGVTYVQPSTLTLLYFNTTLTPPAWVPTTGQVNTQSTTTICGNASVLGDFIVVQNTTPTIALTSSANPSAVGQSITFTATVTPSTATGSVSFTNLGTVALVNGTAAVTTSTLSSGTDVISATYTDPTNFFSTVTAQLTQVVTQATSTTTLMSSATSVVYGQPVTLTAIVTGTAAGLTPTGTITFKDGTTTLGSVALAAGQATFTTSTLAVTHHSLTAVYSGDSIFPASTSSAVVETITKATAAVTVTSSPNPATYGQSITFTATVSAVAPGSGAPTGTVTFKAGATSYPAVPIVGGQATLTLSTLTPGTQSITASYSGDGNFNKSISPNFSQTVSKALPVSTLTSSPNSPVYGQSVTLTAVIAPSTQGIASPTGSVTFKNGSTILGQVALSAGQAGIVALTLPVGSDSISAVYSGDSNYSAGTPAVLVETVNLASSQTSLMSSPNPSKSGQAVTFNATITAIAPGKGTPTGTVTFYNGSSTLDTASVGSGKATLKTSTLASGTYTITAVYSGDAHFSGSTSPALTQTVK
jgi:hypothetical protein